MRQLRDSVYKKPKTGSSKTRDTRLKGETGAEIIRGNEPRPTGRVCQAMPMSQSECRSGAEATSLVARGPYIDEELGEVWMHSKLVGGIW
jgi:hypothetical protein